MLPANGLTLSQFSKFGRAEQHYPYPVTSSSQMRQVSQYFAITMDDELRPKNYLSRKLRNIASPNFAIPELQNTVYAVLADLNLPIYVTTNYDHLMEDALRSKGKDPKSDYCVWKKEITPTESESENWWPTPANPLVFHLLGDIDIKRTRFMVLTEKDYIDFLIHLSQVGDMGLPHSLRRSLATSALLFCGCDVQDLSFLVIQGFVNLVNPIERTSIAIQISDELLEKKNEIGSYLRKFSKNLFKMNLYWGDPDRFLEELRMRWQEDKS